MKRSKSGAIIEHDNDSYIFLTLNTGVVNGSTIQNTEDSGVHLFV